MYFIGWILSNSMEVYFRSRQPWISYSANGLVIRIEVMEHITNHS